jgi:hypothetical protein
MLSLIVAAELLEFSTLELLGGIELELETSTELLDKELLDKKLLDKASVSDEDEDTASDEDEKSSSSSWPVLLEQAKTRKEPKIAKKIEKRSIIPSLFICIM